MSNSNRRPGTILVAVLAALIVMTLVTAKLSTSLLRQNREANRHAGEIQTLWIADAGVRRARQQFTRNPEYRGETCQLPTRQANVQATAAITILPGDQAGPPQVRVTAEWQDGRGEQVRRTIVAELEPPLANAPGNAPSTQEPDQEGARTR